MRTAEDISLGKILELRNDARDQVKNLSTTGRMKTGRRWRRPAKEIDFTGASCNFGSNSARHRCTRIRFGGVFIKQGLDLLGIITPLYPDTQQLGFCRGWRIAGCQQYGRDHKQVRFTNRQTL